MTIVLLCSIVITTLRLFKQSKTIKQFRRMQQDCVGDLSHPAKGLEDCIQAEMLNKRHKALI